MYSWPQADQLRSQAHAVGCMQLGCDARQDSKAMHAHTIAPEVDAVDGLGHDSSCSSSKSCRN